MADFIQNQLNLFATLIDTLLCGLPALPRHHIAIACHPFNPETFQPHGKVAKEPEPIPEPTPILDGFSDDGDEDLLDAMARI